MPRRSAPRNDSGGGAIAPHVRATADTWQISACHCEPVRTLVRQSASPQGNGASWLLFRQIRYAFRICPKYCFSVLCYRKENGLPRRFAPRNDSGGGAIAPHVRASADACPSSACHCEQRSCNRRHLANFCMSLRTSAHTGAAIRVPAEKPGKVVVLRATS